MEHDEQAERMEEDADRLEQHKEQLGDRIDEVQDDWQRKEQDVSVPGAQPDADEEEESRPGIDADEETVSEEGGP
jgi:LDH2 family malate/lactate/ureidoglycolate dehydrogenase